MLHPASTLPLSHNERPRSMPLLRKLFLLPRGARVSIAATGRGRALSSSPARLAKLAEFSLSLPLPPPPLSPLSLPPRPRPCPYDRKLSGRRLRLHHNNLLPRHPNPVHSTVYFCTFYNGLIEAPQRKVACVLILELSYGARNVLSCSTVDA